MPTINSSKLLRTTATALLLLSSSIAAQEFGGDAKILDRINGQSGFGYFGDAVANAGDVNGDGTSDILIGAPRNTIGSAGYEGSAFVYSGRNGALLYQYDGTFRYSGLGDAVAGLGDINGDNFDDFVIGAPGPWQDDLDVCYVYSGRTGLLLYQVADVGGFACTPVGDLNLDGVTDFASSKLDAGVGSQAIGEVSIISGATGARMRTITTNANGTSYGYSVAGNHDLDNDGFHDLIIGEPFAMANGTDDVGQVHVISGRTGQPMYLLQPPTLEADMTFGFSVATIADLTGDQIPDILVGAPSLNSAASGDLFLYSGADGSLLLRMPNPGTGISFGSSICALGDITGDGIPDIAVGDMGWSGNQPHSGAVYLLSGLDFSILHRWSDLPYTERLGSQITLMGDLNLDGAKEFVLSAPRASRNNNTYYGSVFLGSFRPMIEADVLTVSAAAGGVVNMELSFQQDAANFMYQTLISSTGRGPFMWGELSIPLTQDMTVLHCMAGIYPVSTHTGMTGTLDSAAKANASITIPGGLLSSMIGRKFWCAAVARDAGTLPEFSSSSVSVEITP